MAALGAGGRVDDAVDQRRAAGGQCLERRGQLGRGGGAVARTAERLDELVVAGADRQRRWRGVGGDGLMSSPR